MRKIYLLPALAVAIAVVSPATANDRYRTKPPVILSPDLAAPWVMQLNGGQARQRAPQVQRQVTRRYAVTPQKQRKIRQASVKPVQKKKAVKPQIAPQFLPQVVSYNSSEKAGTIIIDTQSRFLYLVLDNGKARRYGVGVGKAGFEWTGSEKITQKKEWPSWRPPAEMIAREKKKGRHLPTFMEGGPQNPLGARALYLGSTLYRIHGTNQPWTIGQAVSSGCIRMRNQDVVDLYERAAVGAKVRVI
ncbi:MAG: L,D-transpeptidase [Lentilitoribacter sp.]